MKKKKSKQPELFITREIRQFFKTREIERMQRYKDRFVSLKNELARSESENIRLKDKLKSVEVKLYHLHQFVS